MRVEFPNEVQIWTTVSDHCFVTTFQVAICIANHYNNLTIDIYLYTMLKRKLVTRAESLKDKTGMMISM